MWHRSQLQRATLPWCSWNGKGALAHSKRKITTAVPSLSSDSPAMSMERRSGAPRVLSTAITATCDRHRQRGVAKGRFNNKSWACIITTQCHGVTTQYQPQFQRQGHGCGHRVGRAEDAAYERAEHPRDVLGEASTAMSTHVLGTSLCAIPGEYHRFQTSPKGKSMR